MEKEIVTILETNGLRITKPRLKVFSVLSSANKPLYIHDIVARCADVDRVSVYRTLDLFHRLQVLDIIHVGWKKQYELSQLFKPHHHHLHCNSCGQITELHSNKLEAIIEELANESDFSASSHRFEVTGLCATCRGQFRQ